MVPVLLGLLIICSIIWYGFVYDRTFTRDMLLQQARYHSTSGNSKLGSWFYDLAYKYSGQDETVAIELANQFKSVGNYTKAEATLSSAIADGGTAELYMALCKTYVEQDKLLDAVNMLDSIVDPEIKAQLDELRPEAPTSDPAPGFYSQYISVALSHSGGTLYYILNDDYPSTEDDPYQEPFTLPGGETVVRAVVVADNGLVSPLSTLGFTVGGVIEPVYLDDPAIEQSLMDLLQPEKSVLYSNQLWTVTSYVVPEDANALDDLSHLTYLESLEINGKRIDSLRFLSSLTCLTELKLTGCRFPAEDLSIIAALPNLEKLTLSDCGLSTVAGLENAQNVQYLDLSRNSIGNLDSLSSMIHLRETNLSKNAITSLNAVSSLNSLEKLDASYNSISSIAPISVCQRITWLDVSNNSLGNLGAIDNLSALTHLAADNNNLTDISVLANCTELLELSVAHNSISDISMLSTLTKLESFDFGYNEVEVLPAWPEGSALRSITGTYNKLKDLTPLGNLQSLSYVYMDYNEITSVASLEKCFNLVMVNVYGNKVTGVDRLTAHDIIVNYDPT